MVTRPRPPGISILVGRHLAKTDSERDGWRRNKAGMGWGARRPLWECAGGVGMVPDTRHGSQHGRFWSLGGMGEGETGSKLCLRRTDWGGIGPRSSSFHPEATEEPDRATRCKLAPGRSFRGTGVGSGPRTAQNLVHRAARNSITWDPLGMQTPRPRPALLSQKLRDGVRQSAF